MPVRRIKTALGLAALALVAAGCHRASEASEPVEKPGLVLLPDSAIAARPSSPEAQLARFLASDAPAPRTFRFEGTEFEPWASKPNPPTLRTMYTMVQILRAYPKATVTLTGYTDNEGTPEQNLVLARQRVARLRAILIQGGIREGRITAIGKGATDFIADNRTEAGRALNRRIEVTVTGK